MTLGIMKAFRYNSRTRQMAQQRGCLPSWHIDTLTYAHTGGRKLNEMSITAKAPPMKKRAGKLKSTNIRNIR